MKLNKIAVLVSYSLLGLTITSCSTTEKVNNIAQDSPAAKIAPKLVMGADASYTAGYQVGSGIAAQKDFDLNLKQAADGFEAAIKDTKARISKKDIERNMESLKDKMVKRQLEIVEENKTKSADFMYQISKLENITKVNDGVYYQTITKGDGDKPKDDSKITIAYKGTLPVEALDQNKATAIKDIKSDELIGRSFDSSENATFPLTNLIECWKDAIPEISVGSTVILYCSPDKGYGTRAPASIGPNQALSFRITLKSFK